MNTKKIELIVIILPLFIFFFVVLPKYTAQRQPSPTPQMQQSLPTVMPSPSIKAGPIPIRIDFGVVPKAIPSSHSGR